MSQLMNIFFENVLHKFPKQLSFAFAYGSGVFSQNCRPLSQNDVVDFIFAVDDPHSWHRANLQLNRKHYSFIKVGGSKLLTQLQEKSGAKVYFNTLVPVDGRVIKYGVIKTSHLIEDLLDWHTLYISGRMHKPIAVIKETKNIQLKQAIVQNLQNAVHTALLCLPEVFTPEQLFIEITGLSYSGDFRMYVGEDKKKVQNIVHSQLDHFCHLYEDILKAMTLIHWKQGEGVFEQDCSPLSVLHHLNLLPKGVQHNLLLAWNKDGRHRDIEEVLQALAYNSYCKTMVSKAVCDIVWWPCFTQSCKGILTAGFIKSIRYSSKKLLKMLSSL